MENATDRSVPSEALLECPFCGGHATYWNCCETLHYVSCNVCDVQTTDYDSAAEAVTAWNNRPFFTLGFGVERWNCYETGMTWHIKVYFGPWVLLIDPRKSNKVISTREK